MLVAKICVAVTCIQVIKETQYLCDVHWNLLPVEHQEHLVELYVAGQYRNSHKSHREWQRALIAAKDALAQIEGK